MGKPRPVALWQRVIAFVEEGHSHRAACARFPVSVKFVNDIVILKRATGGLAPRAQGSGGGHGRLVSLRDWITARVARTPDLTLNDLVGERADHHGIRALLMAWMPPSDGINKADHHPSSRSIGIWL